MDSENVERDYKQGFMINWRELTKDEQIAALQNVAGAKHIPPQAVEKDLWVTTVMTGTWYVTYKLNSSKNSPGLVATLN